MPKFNVPLNTATSMVGCVAFGLMIDNAIHILFRFQQQAQSGQRISQNFEHVMMHCLEPLSGSALILAGGFAVTLLGQVYPTVQFGFLMALTLVFAWASNLFVLPAALAIFSDGRR